MKISKNAAKQLIDLNFEMEYYDELMQCIAAGNVFEKVETKDGAYLLVGYGEPYNGSVLSVKDDTIVGAGYLYEITDPKYIPQWNAVLAHGGDGSCVWDADTMNVICKSGKF